jgi:hypothetical protein
MYTKTPSGSFLLALGPVKTPTICSERQGIGSIRKRPRVAVLEQARRCREARQLLGSGGRMYTTI